MCILLPKNPAYHPSVSVFESQVDMPYLSTSQHDRVQFKLNAIDFLSFPAFESKGVIVDRTAAVSTDIEGLAVFSISSTISNMIHNQL